MIISATAMPTTGDPYVVLGVAVSACAEDIKRAFRKKAALYHPDRNASPEAPALFRATQQAFDLLSDEARRRAFDEQRKKHLLDDPDQVIAVMWNTYLTTLE
jgi:curved DNA-binding protein CbpA